MKNAFRVIWALFLSLLALLCACSRERQALTEQNAPRHFHELQAVEALLETDPPKAMDSVSRLMTLAAEAPFSLLDSIELQLRLVQAQYKNRCLSEQSLDLSSIVAFYDSLATIYPEDDDLQYLRANAYYYRGAQWTSANEDVNAFTHYLKALEVMHQREAWKNPYAKRFVALTYTRLSEILYRYGLRDAALETCHKAASYYESEADLAAMLRFEAAIYQSQKDYDKALSLYDDAQQLVPVGDEPIQLSVGAKLFELQQYDSAVPHLLRAFANGDRYARIDAAAKLAEVYCDKDMGDQELAYTRFYVENSMMESRMASRKMEIEYLYNDYKQPKTEPAVQKKDHTMSVLLLLLLLLSVIAIMAFIIIRNRKRISHIENKITTIEQKHEQENADKAQEIEQISQALNDTREQLNAQRVDFDEAWQTFLSSSIVNKIKHSVEDKDIMIKSVGAYPKLKLKELDYIDLVQETNRCFPDFSSRFLKHYPDLNIADLRHCCLGLLGMNDAEIAVLEGISYSGANRRTNKILTAMKQGNTLEQAMILYLKNEM